jgi:pyruvate,water dikinase
LRAFSRNENEPEIESVSAIATTGHTFAMTPRWVADDEPNQRFTLYCRANVGEVFPNVLSPLTATLIGPAVQKGQTASMCSMGVLTAAETTGPAAGTGVFGGYLYMNAAAMRLFGVRMIGMSVADVDEQVLGEVTGLPPYSPSPGDRNLRASLRLGRSTLRLLRRPDLTALDTAKRAARAWLATMPHLTSASDTELLGWLDTYPPRQAASMERLLSSGLVASAPRGLLDQLASRRSQPGLVNRIVGGIGDVDSARLAQGIWRMARLVADDSDAVATFEAMSHGSPHEATSPAALSFTRAFADFLVEHGHRGNDEYELATPAWVMDPAGVFAAVDRLRGAPDDRDPIAASARLAADAEVALGELLRATPRPLHRMVRRIANVARRGSVARERAKDVLVLENLGARLVLHELMRRAASRGGPRDTRLAFCITRRELADFVAAPTTFADVLAERDERRRYLAARVPPPWFDSQIPDPSTWPLRSDAAPAAAPVGSLLQGIAVSGGTASGRARVVHDPSDPRGLDAGDVLVCAITDPSWTPLFLAAAAVVCDTGAVQSHAAIVARELGIPAVMSVPGITAIADGTPLFVDGNAGTVRVG